MKSKEGELQEQAGQKHLNTVYMDISENSGTPKSSILIGFSIINHPFWGTPIFGNTHIYKTWLISFNVLPLNYLFKLFQALSEITNHVNLVSGCLEVFDTQFDIHYDYGIVDMHDLLILLVNHR